MIVRSALIFCAALVGSGLVAGCRAFHHQSEGLLEQQTAAANISSRELRANLDDYIKQYADEVEEAADRIITSVDDRKTRINALHWKANGISACFQAAARPDPLAAFLDIWILNKQTIALLERPNEDTLFGPWQGMAIGTVKRLELPLLEIQAAIGEDFPLGEDFVTSFARDYPVESLYFRRESVSAKYTEYVGRIKTGDRELIGVVGGLDDRLDQLNKLSALYAEFLPKQARWQSELLLLDAIPTAALAAPLDDLATISGSMDRIAHVSEEVPHLVEREREVLQRTVRQERIATLNTIERMRQDTVTQLSAERVAVMSAVREERVAITDELKAYTDQVLAQSESTLAESFEELTGRAERVSDHVMKRFAQLSACGVIVMAGVAFLLLRIRPVRLPLRLQRSAGDEETDADRSERGAAA